MEERLAILELEVARIQTQLNGERYGVIGRTDAKMIDAMFGMFANNPHAGEVLREIEDERERDREKASVVNESTVLGRS